MVFGTAKSVPEMRVGTFVGLKVLPPSKLFIGMVSGDYASGTKDEKSRIMLSKISPDAYRRSRNLARWREKSQVTVSATAFKNAMSTS